MNKLGRQFGKALLAVSFSCMTTHAWASSNDQLNADDVLAEMEGIIESASEWDMGSRIDNTPAVINALAQQGRFEAALSLALALKAEHRHNALGSLGYYVAQAGETELLHDIIDARPGMRVWGAQNPPDYRDPLEMLLNDNADDAALVIERLKAEGDQRTRFEMALIQISGWLSKYSADTVGKLLDVGVAGLIDAGDVDGAWFSELMNSQVTAEYLEPLLEAVRHMQSSNDARMMLAGHLTYRAAQLGKIELALTAAEHADTLDVYDPYYLIAEGLIEAGELDSAYRIMSEKNLPDEDFVWLADHWLEQAIIQGMPLDEAQAWFDDYIKDREIEPYFPTDRIRLQAMLDYLSQSDEKPQLVVDSLQTRHILSLKFALTIRHLHLGEHDEAKRMFDEYRKRVQTELERPSTGEDGRIIVKDVRAGDESHVRMLALGVKLGDFGLLQEAKEDFPRCNIPKVIKQGLSEPYAWGNQREELLAAIKALISDISILDAVFSRDVNLEVSPAGKSVLHNALLDRVLSDGARSHTVAETIIESARIVGRLDEVADRIDDLFEGRQLRLVQAKLVNAYALDGEIDRAMALAREAESDSLRARLMANILFGMQE